MKTFAVYFLNNPEIFPPSVFVENIQAENKDQVKDEAFAKLRLDLLANDFSEKDVDDFMEYEYLIVWIVEVVEPAEIEEYYWTKDSE